MTCHAIAASSSISFRRQGLSRVAWLGGTNLLIPDQQAV